MSTTKVYDLEVFPNFFSATFIDGFTESKDVFTIYKDTNQLKELIEYINKCEYLVGYNNSKYDDIIINYLIKNPYLLSSDSDTITQVIYQLGQEIITSQQRGVSIYFNTELTPYLWSKFTSVDIMGIMAFDKNKVSLKQLAIAIKWPKIQDLPKSFDEPVLPEEVNKILSYNENDVLITKEAMKLLNDEIAIREKIGKKYNLNLYTSSRSAIADKLISKFWSNETGQEYRDFRNKKTERTSIDFSECVSDKIKFETPVLSNLLEDIKSIKWIKGDGFKRSVIFDGSKYDILLGGLHSNNPPMVVEETKDIRLVDLDFGRQTACITLIQGRL